MRLTSLMMFTSTALLFILIGYIGFAESAPRISPSDASPVSGRKSGSASHTWDPFLPGSASSGIRSGFGPTAGIPGSSGFKTATTFQPPTTATSRSTALRGAGIISPSKEPITAPSSRLTGTRKRSTEAQTLYSPEKTLQTMVSMVSQHTTNDAWAADAADPPDTSVENQEAVCNCSSGSEGIDDPDKCNQSTGQCSCLTGYAGLQCDECEEEYFTNGTSGCLPCSCDSFGAVHLNCDSSGTCTCKTGVYGTKCDDCHPGFFHFSNTGCRPCQCNNHTSYCHPQSGEFAEDGGHRLGPRHACPVNNTPTFCNQRAVM
ncbi:PREDICTED: multiple epidermal growth factor-like domains protein 9 [Cyprinodon variegatus]|uniref:multiple epidermal growth factor-like domains protein 9 n=1 Tax=Cyprinodon variegatus TaxID=28743 RepID=UPI00074296B0|nr:PREDICTED: multiple epidermal growth factor-like domains protein 9 [Cyprinodon variegatus]